MSQAPTAREVALDLIAAAPRRKRPLDDALDDNPAMHQLPGRDRAFARLLVATVLRRLGQIDVLVADCLSTPLAPRAAAVHDILRLGIAQLLFLRTPPHAAVATSVDLAHSRGFMSHKGLFHTRRPGVVFPGPPPPALRVGPCPPPPPAGVLCHKGGLSTPCPGGCPSRPPPAHPPEHGVDK